MSGTVEELQGLLKQASARYGSLEEKMEEATTEHKEEISRRNEAIRLLKKELEDANELIKTLKNKSKWQETGCRSFNISDISLLYCTLEEP